MTIRCIDCKYIDVTVQRPGQDREQTGMCRYPPPVVTAVPGQPQWPFCKFTDWCGRFVERVQS